MKLGEAWSDKQTFRKLKDKGSVLFHVLNLNVKITTTFLMRIRNLFVRMMLDLMSA